MQHSARLRLEGGMTLQIALCDRSRQSLQRPEENKEERLPRTVRRRRADYTRRDAIEDGQLIDLSRWASSRDLFGGMPVPIATTATAWASLHRRTGLDRPAVQAAQVLRAAGSAVLESLPLLGRVPFRVRGDGRRARLAIAFHLSDADRLVATIMLDRQPPAGRLSDRLRTEQ